MLRRYRSLCSGAVLILCQAASAAQPPAQSWQTLDEQVTELYAKGDLHQAIDIAQAALRVASSPRESGRSLDRLGFLLYTSGDLANGEKYLRQSLQTREAAFGAESVDAAETANDLAMLLRDLRRMDDARALAERAVAIRERLLGADTLPLAESLDTLGTVYGLSGQYERAVARFEQALRIHEERPSSDRASEEYGTLCVNLAGTYQRLGKYSLSEATFRKGLDALRVKPGVQHPAYAASELAYAALEVDLGQYVEAERLYDEGGRLVQEELGDQHPVYATLLNNRGFFYQSIGNFAAAQADYTRSLELKRKLYGPGSLLAVSTLRNLAHLTYALDPRKGEQLLGQAVDAYARLDNAPPFDYTSVLVGLARAQRARGALGDARVTATRAVDVSRRGLGEQHPLFAAATRELGLAIAASGEDAESERLLRSALATAESVHGPSHPDVAAFLDALGDFYVKRGDFASAEPLYARSLAIEDRFLSDVLAIGSERFKTATMAALVDPVPRLIAFQAAAPQRPAARALALEAVTRRKGRVIEQVRDWRRWIEQSTAEDVRRRFRDWQAIAACRTSLTVALGYHDLKPPIAGACTLEGTDLAGRYERLLSDLRARWSADVSAQAVRAIGILQERADALETALNRDAGGSIGRVDRATVDDLRSRLADDEALVEIVSYAGDVAVQRDRAVRRYGAFVLGRTGPIGWADLGATAPIDAAVDDLLSAARDWSVSIANHEAASARASLQTAQQARVELSRRVWRRIDPLVDAKTIKQLRIAPDGPLNLVPFEALSDGRDLIDRFTITYLPAGRDLLVPQAPSATGAPVVVVSPGSSSSPQSEGLGRLDAATMEAADVRRLVTRARLYTGSGATERHVKELHAPALLHIVGHGVVRGGACSGAGCESTALGASTDAMTLAAVVLEEAYGRGAGSSEDGFLTALELQNLDLRGTEMLVLSQCQMASGLASAGDGVYGMRRAAIVAGANTFVAPLWNVEDAAQRRLMQQFYDALARGASRGDALRRAKLSLRRSPGTSSFLYWAPVILSGSSAPIPPALFRR